MSDLTLSVIIPTYNRAATLRKTLDALALQEPTRLGCEILVVDDGSTDDTLATAQAYIEKGMPVRFMACPHRGPAAARNTGIDHSQGRLILFMGDDMIASPRFLQAHLEAHDEHPVNHVAIVGDVRWSPELVITPFMHWLDHGGPYFSFYELANDDRLDHRYFITANLSLKRAFLADERFDETFIWAAYEDTELGYRLMKSGLQLLFKPIPVYHLHPVTVESAAKRMYYSGRAARQLERKWPEITGLEYIHHSRMQVVLRRKWLSAGINGCLRPIVGGLNIRWPSRVYRYLLNHARWRGYVEERQAELDKTG